MNYREISRTLLRSSGKNKDVKKNVLDDKEGKRGSVRSRSDIKKKLLKFLGKKEKGG